MAHAVSDLTIECSHSRSYCVPSCSQTFLSIHRSCTSTTTTTELLRPQIYSRCSTTTSVRYRKSFHRCRSKDSPATAACRCGTYQPDRTDQTGHGVSHCAPQTQSRWLRCDWKMGCWRSCHCEERGRRGRRGQAEDAQRTSRKYCVVPSSQAQRSWYSSKHNDGDQNTA